jgi:hypothetical protein
MFYYLIVYQLSFGQESQSHLKNHLHPDREVDFQGANFDRTANPKRALNPHLNPEVSGRHPAQVSTQLKILLATSTPKRETVSGQAGTVGTLVSTERIPRLVKVLQ